MGFTCQCHTPKKHSTHIHTSTTPPANPTKKIPKCKLTLHLLPPPPPPPVFDRHDKTTKTTPEETQQKKQDEKRTRSTSEDQHHPDPITFRRAVVLGQTHLLLVRNRSKVPAFFYPFSRIRGQTPGRMCYVGKATKIFIFIVTALVVLGLVIGFGLLRQSLHHHSHAHQCSGDSSSCTFSSPVVSSPTTPIYPSTPDSGSSSTQPAPSSSNPPPSPTASTTPSSYPPPPSPILSPPVANPTAPSPTSPSLPLSPPPTPPAESPPPPPPPAATTGAAPPYTSPPSPVVVTPGPEHA